LGFFGREGENIIIISPASQPEREGGVLISRKTEEEEERTIHGRRPERKQESHR
jgi:hypothetical protein